MMPNIPVRMSVHPFLVWLVQSLFGRRNLNKPFPLLKGPPSYTTQSYAVPALSAAQEKPSAHHVSRQASTYVCELEEPGKVDA